jgi:hypothetical protein
MTKFTHKWLPRFFYKKFDGGKDSGVTGYFLIEWKCLFSIGLLHFKEGSREAFHSHAFNALSWFVTGAVREEHLDGETKEFKPSIKPKYTKRTCFHKVFAHTDTWCFTIRGPWEDKWLEYRPVEDKMVTLTHGRKEVGVAD